MSSLDWKSHPAIQALLKSPESADLFDPALIDPELAGMDYDKNLETFGPTLAGALDPARAYTVVCSESETEVPADVEDFVGPWASGRGPIVQSGGDEGSSWWIAIGDSPRGKVSTIELGGDPATAGFHLYVFPSQE